MEIRRLYAAIYVSMATLVLAALVLGALTLVAHRELAASYEQRYDLYLLADELRHSSDDLTSLARTYVDTQDQRYADAFAKELAIRHGEAPLPRHFERIYWDLALVRGQDFRGYVPAKSLNLRLRQAGISPAEQDKLLLAESRSDELAQREIIAMNAVRGLYRDANGHFTVHGEPDLVLARGLLNDADYHRIKADIMAPIDDFFELLMARTQREVQDSAHRVNLAFSALLVSLLLLLTFVFWAFVVMRQRITKPLLRVCEGVDASARLYDFSRYLDEEPAGELRRLTQAINQLMQSFTVQRDRLRAEMAENERQAIELKQAIARAEAADRAKSVFLANMSHEIRTPLNVILGHAQLLLRDSKVDENERQQLHTMNQAGQHLLELINAVLDISRIEAGKMEIHAEPFDCGGLLNTLSRLSEVQCTRRSLHWKFDNRLPEQCVVRGDRRKVSQVIFNLVGNAIKFTEEGAVVMSAWTGDDGAIHIAVVDDGPGIEIKERDALFSAFYQTASGAAAGGAGLGLAISFAIVEAMGGLITLDNEPGHGCRAEVALPLPKADGSAPVDALDDPMRVVRGKFERPLRALAVDDVAQNREVLERVLTGMDVEVIMAADGAEGYRLAEETLPDIVFLDLRMPVLDGVGALKLLRQSERTRAIPVVVITASSLSTNREEHMAIGFDDYIGKPFVVGEIVEVIARLVHVHFVRELDRRPKAATEGVDGASPLDAMSTEHKHVLVEAARDGELTLVRQRLAEWRQQEALDDESVSYLLGFVNRCDLEGLESALTR